jgi:methyl-accepting chemotaxis protein
VLDAADLERLDASFHAYYDLARATTVRLIGGEFGESINGAMVSMQEQYNAIRGTLESNTSHDEAMVTSAFASMRRMQRIGTLTLTGVILLMLVVLVIASLYVARAATRPLHAAVQAANALAQGDLSASVEADSRDETGQLLTAMDAMTRYLKEMAGIANEIAAGNLQVRVQPRSASDSFGKAFLAMTENLADVISEVHATASAVSSSARTLAGHQRAGGLGGADHPESRADERLDHAERQEQLAHGADGGHRGARRGRERSGRDGNGLGHESHCRKDLDRRGDRAPDEHAGPQRGHRGGACGRPGEGLRRRGE